MLVSVVTEFKYPCLPLSLLQTVERATTRLHYTKLPSLIRNAMVKEVAVQVAGHDDQILHSPMVHTVPS